MAELQTDKSQQRVGVHEFRRNLTGFLRQVRQGRSFLVSWPYQNDRRASRWHMNKLHTGTRCHSG
jgi:hypothetical protein